MKLVKIITLISCLLASTAQAATMNVIGFETGDSSEANGSAGTFSIQSTTKRTGDYALQVNPTTTNTGHYRIATIAAFGANSVMNASDLYVRFYLYIVTAPSADSEEFFSITNGVTNKISGRINSDRTIGLYDNLVSQLGSNGATVLSLNTWYLIEVLCGTGATANYELKINGVSELSGTGNLFTSNAQYLRLGKVNNRNGETVDFIYDDVSLSDSAYPGAGQVVRMDVDGNGTYTNWNATTTTWMAIDESPHDGDNEYASSTVNGNMFSSTLESSSGVGISGTINVVKVVNIIREVAAGGYNITFLRSGSTDSKNTAYGISGSYVANSRLLTVDPADSVAWTTADLDSVEIGAENDSDIEIRSTAQYLMVDFTPAASPPASSGWMGDFIWFDE